MQPVLRLEGRALSLSCGLGEGATRVRGSDTAQKNFRGLTFNLKPQKAQNSFAETRQNYFVLFVPFCGWCNLLTDYGASRKSADSADARQTRGPTAHCRRLDF